MPKKEPYSRGWCFTINNWTDNHLSGLMEMYEFDDDIRYLVIGFEKGDRKNTPHIQGYVYFQKKVCFECVKLIFLAQDILSVHVEPQAAKSNVAAYQYCMKEYDYIEYGSRPRQGHRTDLEVIKCDLMSGKKTLKDISLDNFSQWCQYRRAFNEFLELHAQTQASELISFSHGIAASVDQFLEQYDPKTDYYEFGGSPIKHLLAWKSGKYKKVFVDDFTNDSVVQSYVTHILG